LEKWEQQQMTNSISHDRADESLEAKARWFQSLTMEQRMDVFQQIMELALAVNSRLMERKNAQRPQGPFRVAGEK